MTNFLTCVVLTTSLIGSWATARSIDWLLRQLSGAQYINATEFGTVSASVQLDISINGGGRNKTAPLLYGWMFEDISHSGDGGIYAEMLVNRAFQGSVSIIGPVSGVPGSSIQSAENPILPLGPVPTGWKGIGNVSMGLTLLHPLSDALPVVLQRDIPWNATGEVGILNQGFWGMDVRPGVYNTSFFILSDKARNNGTLSGIDVSLRSNLTSDVWCTRTIPISGTNISDFEWMQYSAQLTNTVKAPNANNTFAITFDASEVAGNTYYFGLVSLFPETYNNPPNGLRRDFAGAVRDLGATFLRFPGGNNIEGYSIEQRWKWQDTIGPLRYRKGRIGDWGYTNTKGLGLLEFLEWCEDMAIEPLLAVYAGFSLSIWGQEGTSFPESHMGIVLADILNELEYCMGDASTHYGALRAEHGHPEPFKINYIEIGNEDWFSSTYPYRFPILYEGIKKAYPDITLISTAYSEANSTYNYTISIPPGAMWDTHHHETPSFFLEQFDYWDNWQEATNNENVTIFVGEYAAFQAHTVDGVVNFTLSNPAHIAQPDLLGAIAESVYLIGAERNPNVVKMTAYAPSFQNLNWLNWDPDLVAFTADYDETVLSVSYYSQQMFAQHRGTETLPVATVRGSFNPLWWVATIEDTKNEMYFKVVNSGNSSIPLAIHLDVSYSAVQGTILTSAHLTDFNYLGNQTAVIPVPMSNLPTVSGSASSFARDVPAYSINVIQFDLAPVVPAGIVSNPSATTSAGASSASMLQMSDGHPQASKRQCGRERSDKTRQQNGIFGTFLS